MGLVGPFALFVWPTAYRYDHVALGVENGGTSTYPMRINRFNGVSEMLRLSSESFQPFWVGMEQPLPPNLVFRLRQNTKVSISGGEVSGTMFNDTEWRILKIRWDVTYGRSTDRITRQVDQRVFIEPNSANLISTYLWSPDVPESAEIAGAWGTEVPSTVR
jgi:hypothetical protein